MTSRVKLLLLALTVAATGWSQSFTAAIRGTVTDSTGAAVPEAKVIVTEADRSVAHPTVTDAQGRYVVTALQPGNYTLTVEASGFKKHVQNVFQLTVQQQASLDIQLQVGDISTAVEVSEAAPLLNTTIANLGQTIDNRFMVSMPNIARDSLSLVYLTPGVVGAGGRRGDNNTNFVVSGTRNSTSDVMVDGVTVTTVEQNSGVTDLKYKPSVDAVQEFKMQTNFFSAEYGQTGGGVVNMVTKSGTNEFHGTGYWFFRDGTLNANDWFANRGGVARPSYRRNQWGGVLGGPVKKNQTFFFAAYENTRAKTPQTNTSTFPTLEQRDGDFSRTLNGSGQLMTIYDPLSYNAATGTRQAFAQNRIPQNRINPVVAKVLPFMPQPNQVTNAVTNTNNWFAQGTSESKVQDITAKIDHNFNESNRITGRYSYNPNTGTPQNLFGENNPAVSFSSGPSRTKTTSSVVDFTRVQSPTTIWTFRYGLIYSNFGRDPFQSFDPTALGLPQYMKDNATNLVFPNFEAVNYRNIGTEGWWIMDRQETVHQVSGSMTKTMGAHNLKVGAEMRQYILDYLQPGYPSGHFIFRPQQTSQMLNTGSSVQGNSFASMLLGFGNGSDYHIDPKAFSRSRYMGFYIQDDWKITRTLTLNLGLRYEFDIPRWERDRRYSYWDLDAQSPIQVPGYDLKGAYRFTDYSTQSPFNGDYNNFSPRVGFAWAANNKTAIRGGAGLLYSLSRATVFGHTGSGFTTNSSMIWTKDSDATQYAGLSNPYPDGLFLPPGRSLGDMSFVGLGANTIVRENRNPEYYQWNLSIQRELGWSSVLEVNYTGNRGVHLLSPDTSMTRLDPSYWGQGRTALQANVSNPFYGAITDTRGLLAGQTIQQFRLLRNMPQFDGASRSEPNRADSVYHGLQVKYEKRFSSGLSALVHYTFSKMIDTASVTSGNVNWLGGTSNMQNFFDYRQERSLSAHDIPHRFVASGVYQLPFGHGRKFASGMNRLVDAFIGGWDISGFLTMQAGAPLQILQDGGQLWDNNAGQRPNLIGDPSTSGRVQDRLNQYFNPAAFTRGLTDTFGSAPRYLGYRGPGIRTLDASLLKSFRVKEGQRAEFRLEMQNSTNTPIFGDPSAGSNSSNTAGANYGSATFGQITGMKVGARNVQLGIKYYF